MSVCDPKCMPFCAEHQNACRCDGRWKDHETPKYGWRCAALGVYDEDQTCEMCGNEEVRQIHTMVHDDFPLALRVGQVCAGHMEDNLDAAKVRATDLKREARQNVKTSVRLAQEAAALEADRAAFEARVAEAAARAVNAKIAELEQAREMANKALVAARDQEAKAKEAMKAAREAEFKACAIYQASPGKRWRQSAGKPSYWRNEGDKVLILKPHDAARYKLSVKNEDESWSNGGMIDAASMDEAMDKVDAFYTARRRA